MYTTFQLAKKYCRYLITASNGKGHGIHSPFVFNFITKVLRDKSRYEWFEKIESVRKSLLQDNTVIAVDDHGAGSSLLPTADRRVKDIARSSLKTRKFAQLLFRMVKYFKPETIVELGTSLGITTAYLSTGNPASEVYTIEGAATIAAVASKNFNTLGIKNIQLVQGTFDAKLADLLNSIKKPGLVFIDGNHRKQPTLEYFDLLVQYCTNHTVLIFDDIHWSREMEEAWEHIKQNPAVMLTIDLFFIGILFFNKEFKAKQHFVIRF